VVFGSKRTKRPLLYCWALLMSGLARPGLLAWVGVGCCCGHLTIAGQRFTLLLCAVIYGIFRVKPWLESIRRLCLRSLLAGAKLCSAHAPPDDYWTKPGGIRRGRNARIRPGPASFDVTEKQQRRVRYYSFAAVMSPCRPFRLRLMEPWFGYGALFTFQGTGIASLQSPHCYWSAHNIYLLAWGETGFVSLLFDLLLVLGIGMRHV